MIYKQIGTGATVFSGYAFKSGDLKSPEGIPVIKIGNLAGRIVDYSDTQFFPEDKVNDKIEKFFLNEGDILIAMTGQGSVGRVAKLSKKSEDDKLLLNQRVGKFVCDESIIDPDYLYYILTTDYYQEVLFNAGTGSGQPNLSPKIILGVEIPFPDIEVQKKVAEALLPLDRMIANNKAIIVSLKEYLGAFFRKEFIDCDEADSWKDGHFSELVSDTIGGDWGKESAEGNYTKKVFCIRGADIPEVSMGNKGKMPTRYILEKNYDSKELKVGDLVVEISGGSPTQSTGRSTLISQALLDRYEEGMICTNFCRAVKPKRGFSAFIYLYWQYLYDKNTFFLYENGTTGIKNLDLSGFLENEVIKIPPVAKLQKLNELFDECMSCVYAKGYQNEVLDNYRDTLLAKMLESEFEF